MMYLVYTHVHLASNIHMFIMQYGIATTLI